MKKRGCITISKIKKFLIHCRTSVKLICIMAVSAFLILGAVTLIYKPIYSVTLNGEFVGYSKDKTQLQKKINDYMDKGEGQNIAFVQIDHLPEYQMCLLKKGIVTNDDEIYEKVKQTGVNYYTYYALVQDEEDKLYVSDFAQAEAVVKQLEEKNSANKASIVLEEKYSTELKEFSTVEDAVAKLYVEQPKVVTKTKRIASNVTARGNTRISTSTNVSGARPSLGISLIQPVSGKLTSRYGERSSIRSSAHTGLDIATSYGTPIKAAASGTVIFAGTKGSYGKLIIVQHGNGVQTYYGHCSSLVATVGQTVSQGQVIAKVGSTGNSTGNHLHLEIRVNGNSYNPQYYLYN